MQVDAILDKIAKSGADSITADERALLESVSGKLRRRAESEKPKSGLAIWSSLSIHRRADKLRARDDFGPATGNA